MKIAFGKLTLLAFGLAFVLLMLAPMRSGIEDSLVCTVDAVSLAPGEAISVGYELRTETAQTAIYRVDDPAVASVDQRGLITALSPGRTKVRVVAQGGVSDVVDVEVVGVPVTTFELNAHVVEMDKGDVSGLSYAFNQGAAAQQVSWESADTSVVQVDAAGRLTAVGAGETVVKATASGGMNDSALVRVHVRGAEVAIIPAQMTVGAGAVFGLSVGFEPADATDAPVRWISSAPEVLAVNEKGEIRAISVGSAVITVKTRDGLSASAQIQVEAASRGFRLDNEVMDMERGESRTLEAQFIGAYGEPDANIDHFIQWKSSDPSVASVENGVVTAVASGEATITASADGFAAVCEVNVRTSVSEVQLNVKEQTLYKDQADEPFLIRTTVLPADADDRKLVFSSDNPLVATVSQNGLVTMTGGYGTAVITVEASSGVKATCTIHVVMSASDR